MLGRAGCQFLAVGTEDRRAQRGQPADAAGAAGRQRSLRRLSGRGDRIDRRPAEVSACACSTNSSARRTRWSPPAASPPISAIRGALQDVAAEAGTPLIMPPPALCTDNGAMIAWAGAERLALGLTTRMDAPPRARWLLDANATAPAASPIRRAGFTETACRATTIASDRRRRLWHRAGRVRRAGRPRRDAVRARRRESPRRCGDARQSEAARRAARCRITSPPISLPPPRADIVLLATPAQNLREAATALAPHLAANARRRLRQGHRARHARS